MFEKFKGVNNISFLFGYGILFFIAYKLLQKFGIIAGREQAIEKNLRNSKAFSITYFNEVAIDFSGIRNEIDNLCTQIYEAKGIVNDNETKALDSFNWTGSKAVNSYLTMRFSALYNEDLLSYLRSFFSTKDWITLAQIINLKKDF